MLVGKYSFLDFLKDFAIATGILPLIVSYLARKHISKPFTPIYILCWVSFICDVIGSSLRYSGKSNYLVFHTYTFLECILISLFYYFFSENKKVKIFLMSLCFLFLMVAVGDSMVFGSATMDGFSMSVESVLLILYFLVLFFFLVKEPLSESLTQQPVFWANTAVLFYFGGNLAMFAFTNYIFHHYPNTHGNLWALVHPFFQTAFNVLLSIGFWKLKKT